MESPRTVVERTQDVGRAYELYREAARTADLDTDDPPTPSPRMYFRDRDLYETMKSFVTHHSTSSSLSSMLDNEFGRYCCYMVDTFPPPAIDAYVIATAAAMMDAEEARRDVTQHKASEEGGGGILWDTQTNDFIGHGTYYEIDGDPFDPENGANWDGDQMIGVRD